MSNNLSPEESAAQPLDPKIFLPPEGSLAEQIARQVDFLTQGVMECMVRSSGLFEPAAPEAEPPSHPSYGFHRPPAPPHAGPNTRSTELRDAAYLSNATARLIAAAVKLHGEYRFTGNRTDHGQRPRDGKDGRDARDGIVRPLPRRSRETRKEAQAS